MRIQAATVLILPMILATACNTSDVTMEEPGPDYPCLPYHGLCLDSTATFTRAEVDFYIRYIVEGPDTTLGGQWILTDSDNTDPTLHPFCLIDRNELFGWVRNGQIWFTLTPGWYDTGMQFDGTFGTDSLGGFEGRWWLPGFSGILDHGILEAELQGPCP